MAATSVTKEKTEGRNPFYESWAVVLLDDRKKQTKDTYCRAKDTFLSSEDI